MDHTEKSAQERKNGWEEQQEQLLASLYERCAIEPGIRAALAVAWRLGYNKRDMDIVIGRPYIVENPFWKIPSDFAPNGF